MAFKKTLVIGFDRILHNYDGNWQGADVIEGDPIGGSDLFLEEALHNFKVYVVSPRSASVHGRKAMFTWCANYYGYAIANALFFPGHAPPAWVTLDYRLMPFTGEFPSVQSLKDFVPIAEEFKVKKAQEEFEQAAKDLKQAEQALEDARIKFLDVQKAQQKPAKKTNTRKR